MIEQKEDIASLKERLQRVCTDNMNLRGGLRDIIDYCNKVEKGEIIGTQDYLMNAIKNVAKEVLK